MGEKKKLKSYWLKSERYGYVSLTPTQFKKAKKRWRIENRKLYKLKQVV